MGFRAAKTTTRHGGSLNASVRAVGSRSTKKGKAVLLLEFTSHLHLRSSVRAKTNHAILSTGGYTITQAQTPPEDTHNYEKQIGLLWCCLLDSNSGLNTAGQINHILTWQRNSQMWWRAVITVTVEECFSGRHAIL